MAELSNLKFTVGADVSDLLAQMQRGNKSIQDFKDQLDRFKSAFEKSTDPATLQRLSRAIDATKERLKKLNAASFGGGLGDIKKGSDQASQALMNLGRVAQDAPYGFIGIANNLNPLLESFERLQKETGNFGKSLKALGASMLGAGGIGFALSVFQFLALGGADAIKKLFASAKDTALEGARKELQEFNKTLLETESSSLSTGIKLQSFVDIAKNGQLPLAQRNQALKEANKIMGEHGEKLTLVNIATAAVTEEIKKFTEATIQQALANKFADRAADLVIKQRNAIKEYVKAKKEQIEADLASKKVIEQGAFSQSKGTEGAIIATSKKLSAATKGLTTSVINYKNTTSELNDVYTELAAAQLMASGLFGDIGVKAKDAGDKSKKSIESISDVIAKLYRDIDFFNEKEIAFNTNETKAKLSAYFSTIERLMRDFKVPANSTILNKLFGEAKDIKIINALNTIRTEVEKGLIAAPIEIPIKINAAPVGSTLAPIDFDPRAMIPDDAVIQEAEMLAYLKAQGVTKGFQDGLKKGVEKLNWPSLTKLYDDVRAKTEAFQMGVEALANQMSITTAVAFGDAMGKALSGAKIGDIFNEFFHTILDALGTGIRQLGIEMIGANKAIQLAKKFLGKAPGLAAAVGLVALGTLIKASAAKLTKVPGFANGVQNFSGGLAVVGERGPELVQLPRGSDVIPNNQLSGLSIGGGQHISVSGRFELQNNVLVAAVRRGERSLERQG